MKTKIILDTNFLLIPGKLGVDIFGEIDRVCDFSYDIYIHEDSEEELNNIISNQKGAEVRAAKLAKQLIKAKALKRVGLNQKDDSSSVDTQLVMLAGEQSIIATQDKELKKRILAKKGKVLVLRQKKYIKLVT